jgi:Holliday junction resolvase RusA-like endonuclease
MRLDIKTDFHGVGKNNMGVTRTGIHYPKPAFVNWRKNVMAQVIEQTPKDWKPIDSYDYSWVFVIRPPDNRRRDLPAVLDSLYHVFCKTGIVADDCYIYNVTCTRLEPSKDSGVIIDVIEKELK